MGAEGNHDLLLNSPLGNCEGDASGTRCARREEQMVVQLGDVTKRNLVSGLDEEPQCSRQRQSCIFISATLLYVNAVWLELQLETHSFAKRHLLEPTAEDSINLLVEKPQSTLGRAYRDACPSAFPIQPARCRTTNADSDLSSHTLIALK
jgi:hypothetical protein